jgi:uncharacterized protein (TIGR04255 family)
MATHYKNAPLVEVVAEFHFNPSAEWNLLLPGTIHEQLKKEFPITRQINVFGAVQMGGPTGAVPQIIPQSRLQFVREDGSAMIQTGPNLLAINHLRPYTDWQTSFLPILKTGWDAYVHSGGKQDVQTLKLRYINRIEIPLENGQYRYEDYLEFRPYLNPKLPEIHGPFMLAVSYFHREQRDWLTVHLQVQEGTADRCVLALSLEYALLKEPPGPSELLGWFNEAHGHIQDTFELCINERLRKRLEKLDGSHV